MSKDFEAVAREAEEDDESGPTFEEHLAVTDQDKLDLRTEVFSQIHLLKSIRNHLFDTTGSPKVGTEFKDIRAYMSSSTQLLNMLQKFEEALNTDADFSRVELAMEMAMEDSPCPEFIDKLKFYLAEEGQQQ